MRQEFQRNVVIRPIPLRLAKAFVAENHSYLPPPVGCLFCIQAYDCDTKATIGVVIVGRPISAGMQDGITAEVTRLTLKDGYYGVGSSLLGRAWTACNALGYKRLISYVRSNRSGAVFTAANFAFVRHAFNSPWRNDPKEKPRPIHQTSLFERR